MPSIEGAPEALGWLYVLEMVARRVTPLRTKLHRDLLALAGSYLMTTRHAATRELGSTIDLVTHTPTIAKRVIAGAHAGFESLSSWLATAPAWDGF